MHLFHNRFHRRDRHHPHGRFGAFWHAAFHHARGFHGHDGHHGEAAFRPGRVPLRTRAAAFLDLDDTQVELMDRLFEQVNATRHAAKEVLRGAEFAALLETENFRREDAQLLFDRRLEALKAAGPSVVAAFGDFFDALDFEQQQMLRFALRRRHGHNGRHDAPPAAD